MLSDIYFRLPYISFCLELFFSHPIVFSLNPYGPNVVCVITPNPPTFVCLLNYHGPPCPLPALWSRDMDTRIYALIAFPFSPPTLPFLLSRLCL